MKNVNQITDYFIIFLSRPSVRKGEQYEASANRVLIPMQPQFFSAKGLELLLSTIANVRENLNPNLTIEGALITMYDGRLKFHREVLDTVTGAYGQYFRIFETKIPVSVRVTETQARAQSIFDHDPRGKIAEAYAAFGKELTANVQ